MKWKTETIDLLYPLDQDRVGPDEKPVSEVTIEEPDCEALEAIDELGLDEIEGNVPVKSVRKMIVAMSDLTEGQAKKLHRADIEEIGGRLAPFMQAETDSADGTETKATK
jgi:hypothetical protein